MHWLLAASQSGFKVTDLLHPEFYVKVGGFALICAVVFAESGLLFGFFLPGDSLLFTVGFFHSAAGIKVLTQGLGLPENTFPPLWLSLAALAACAIAGDQVGYMIGHKAGPALFNRPDSRLFKKAYVEKAEAFFEHYGSKAIVLARFVPIVRTFTPVIAGVSKMHYRTFILFNVIGGVAWACGITLLGYFLGGFKFIEQNLELAILAVVFISLLPMVVEGIKHWRARKQGDRLEAEASEPTRMD